MVSPLAAAQSPTYVDVRTPRLNEPLGLIAGYSHVVLEVQDLARARDFYAGVLGFVPDGDAEDGPRLRLGRDQHVVLAQRNEPDVRPDSGIHQAYGFSPDDLPRVLQRLAAAGVEVHGYHEDRPAERSHNRYCFDPDGNRIQLMSGRAGIDHVALETHDLEWSETFFSQLLGGCIESRVGWHMHDFAAALAWGDGKDDCAPGTRRWDKRYTSIEDKSAVPRPNGQLFASFAPGVTLGVYLATEHRQEPPREQLSGTPRTGLRVAPGQLPRVQERLLQVRLRCLRSNPETGGPFERRGSSLLLRDPAGNFLELGE